MGRLAMILALALMATACDSRGRVRSCAEKCRALGMRLAYVEVDTSGYPESCTCAVGDE